MEKYHNLFFSRPAVTCEGSNVVCNDHCCEPYRFSFSDIGPFYIHSAPDQTLIRIYFKI